MATLSEHVEQKMFFEWCIKHCEEYPGLELIFAIPNGGKRDAVAGKRLKDEGVRAGVPDMFLPVARGSYHGLFVEMKVRGGGAKSAAQKEWAKQLSEQGYYHVFANGFSKARESVIGYYDA